jgi:multidrug efflux system outer membrane protein
MHPARNYIDFRSLRRRVELARSNVNLQQETLELTQFGAQAGLATDLDVQQALANVETTRAQIASLESAVGQSIHAIAILLGQPPAELNAEFNATAPIPEAPIEATLGVPADALRRRPDVRSAERLLAAQAAHVNAARADLYPSFRLAGSIGLESLNIARLVMPGAAFWSAGPSANLRLFDRRQLRENLVVQNERQEQAGLARVERRDGVERSRSAIQGARWRVECGRNAPAKRGGRSLADPLVFIHARTSLAGAPRTGVV